MTTIDINKIGELLKGNRFDEAKELVRSVFSEPVSAEDKARIFADYTLAYLQIMNALNDRYEQALEDAIQDIETLEKENVKLENKLQVAKVMMADR